MFGLPYISVLFLKITERAIDAAAVIIKMPTQAGKLRNQSSNPSVGPVAIYGKAHLKTADNGNRIFDIDNTLIKLTIV